EKQQAGAPTEDGQALWPDAIRAKCHHGANPARKFAESLRHECSIRYRLPVGQASTEACEFPARPGDTAGDAGYADGMEAAAVDASGVVVSWAFLAASFL